MSTKPSAYWGKCMSKKPFASLLRIKRSLVEEELEETLFEVKKRACNWCGEGS